MKFGKFEIGRTLINMGVLPVGLIMHPVVIRFAF